MRSALAGVVLLAACGGVRREAPPGKTAPQASEVPPTGAAGGSVAKVHPLDSRVASWLEELSLLADPDAELLDHHDPPAPDLKKYPWAATARVTPEFCRKVTQWEQPFESCALTPLAGGTAAQIAIVQECGQHSCDVKYWVFAQHKATWVSQLEYGGLELEVSPDHRWLMIGRLVRSSPDGKVPELGPLGPMWNHHLQTDFMDLSTGKVVFDLPCSSMVLSPKRKYYVCRDLRGNVLRTPVEQPSETTLEIVVDAIPDESQAIKIGGPFNDYPAPVTFPSETELEYQLYLIGEEVLNRRAPWTE